MVYHQALLAGLKASTRFPTNLNDIRQRENKRPTAFSLVAKAAVVLAFINQAAPDIKQKLQRVEKFGERSLRMFNKRKTTDKIKKQMRGQKQQTPDLAKILLATMAKPEDYRRCLKQIASEEGSKADTEDKKCPLPKPRITINVKGKLTNFFLLIINKFNILSC